MMSLRNCKHVQTALPSQNLNNRTSARQMIDNLCVESSLSLGRMSRLELNYGPWCMHLFLHNQNWNHPLTRHWVTKGIRYHFRNICSLNFLWNLISYDFQIHCKNINYHRRFWIRIRARKGTDVHKHPSVVPTWHPETKTMTWHYAWRCHANSGMHRFFLNKAILLY